MLLSIDSSAVTASASLTENDTVINSRFENTGLTHSETLLPMIKDVLGDKTIADLDGIAISVGPGSFTGVRIGVSTVKGIAFTQNIKCYPVSTLEAIAHNFENGIICAVMDARRMQFYNALFEVESCKVKRLTEDRAISIEDLREEIANYDSVIIAGDGAKLCFGNIGLDNVILADEDKIYQNAVGVARASKFVEPISSAQLMPKYLRLSQAERELKLKLSK